MLVPTDILEAVIYPIVSGTGGGSEGRRRRHIAGLFGKTTVSASQAGGEQSSLGILENPELSGYCVLVVEDEYFIASDIAAALARAGAALMGPYSIAEAAAGAIALRRPDAAIVDIDLGSGPSFDLAEKLEEAAIPFLFVTGYDAQVIPSRFATVSCLEKPLPVQRVVRAVRGLLGRSPIHLDEPHS